MKTLKLKALAGYSVLLSVFMTLLGFPTACSLIGEDPDPRMEYGCPSATFVVKGQITSPTGTQPIPQIRVIMGNGTYNVDTAFTDISGKYEVSVVEFPKDQTFTLKCEDTDGSANGEYATKNVSVKFIDPSFQGGSGSWYFGKTESVLNLTLAPKDDSK